MKNILCFGDSNTYGSNPADGSRFGRYQRWTGRLQSILGSGWYVIEEGLGGRTTVWPDPLSPGRCGIEALPMLLETHSPLDWVIIMLGTNDYKHRFSALPIDIALGIGQLAALTKSHSAAHGLPVPKVLVVSPIVLGDRVEEAIAPAGICSSAVRDSYRLAPLVKAEAKAQSVYFFDAASVAKPSPLDHLHMDEQNHAALAKALADFLQKQQREEEE